MLHRDVHVALAVAERDREMAGQQRLIDEEIVSVVRDDLRRTMGIERAPVVSRVFRWPHANPQYDVGHLARVERIDALLERHAGLYVTGSGLRGTGIPDCITDGRRVASQALRAE